MYGDTAESILDRITWPEEDNRVPRELYLDEDLYSLEMTRIFAGPYWTMVGHASEIPRPGDYKLATLGSHPLIILRDMDGEVRALLNACAHRGTAILHESYGSLAQNKCLTCIYHNWRFDLTGNLVAASLPQDFPADFQREDYGLPRARLALYRGAIFVTLSDETPPLADYLGGLAEGLDLALGTGDLTYLGTQKVMFNCNWKIAAENIYDGYHAVSLHMAVRLLKIRGTSGNQYLPDYARYGHVWTEFQTQPPENAAFLRDPSVLDVRTKNQRSNRIINVFPISIFSDQLDTLALRFAVPRGVDQTEMQFAVFARAGENADVIDHRVRQGSNLYGPEGLVSLEDLAALARVQDGAAARGESVVLKGALNRFPPYRPNDEAGLRHFYAAYRRSMGF
jgi:phenylpropionate dioxygenase-like ring-hydroxylating dioxygenase large terminal subunit